MKLYVNAHSLFSYVEALFLWIFILPPPKRGKTVQVRIFIEDCVLFFPKTKVIKKVESPGKICITFKQIVFWG